VPIEQPDGFEVMINVKTAKVLGIGTPDSARADKVIDWARATLQCNASEIGTEQEHQSASPVRQIIEVIQTRLPCCRHASW
jgi:hypothetical protein